MNKGTVKFFNETKGFGFITMENEQEVFVHISGLREDVRQDDKVTFELQQGQKGMNAVNVRLA
jgi:cold shock protein